jgi:hypothetical protein
MEIDSGVGSAYYHGDKVGAGIEAFVPWSSVSFSLRSCGRCESLICIRREDRVGIDDYLPTGGLRRCEFSSSHLGKLIGGGSIVLVLVLVV